MRIQRFALLIFAGLLCGGAAPVLPGPTPPDDNRKLALDLYRQIIEIRSVHAIGTKEVADKVAAMLLANGFAKSDVHELADPKYPNQMNVVVRLHGRGKAKPILWYGHMDVVDARPEDWSLPPFKFTEKGGYFYGRGTSDMKDQVSAVAASLVRLKKEHFVPDRDIIAAFTADEEVGEEEDGLWYLLRDHRDLVDAAMMINPDGSSGEIKNGKRQDFAVETSEKTYVTYTLEVTNRGGHSSEPRTDNAIYQLAAGLMRLQHYAFPFSLNDTTRLYFSRIAPMKSGRTRADMLAVAKKKSDLAAAARLAKDDSLNAILHTTCVATMLDAGVQENALAQRAHATVQCRLMPDETPEETRATLVKVLADPKIAVKIKSLVTIAPESPPSPQLMGSVERVVHSMWPGVAVLPEMAAGASDSIFARNAGIPAYGISGAWEDVDDVRAHGRDERREEGSYYQSIEFTYRLMKELSKANGE